MPDYSKIAAHCKIHSSISERVIDHFLMYYAAEREGFERIMNAQFSKFEHLNFGQSKEAFLNFCRAEYIVSKIFLKNGLIKKYLNHSAIKQLPADDYMFLQQQSMLPWKFSFAFILRNPADCFYEMQDVFTDEKYMLYSPSVKNKLQESDPLLWFNLVGFNGECWQTFGIVTSFRSFDEDDIFFFATEINPAISDAESLIDQVEQNPVPFFMLSVHAETPRVFHKEHALAHLCSTDAITTFSMEGYTEKFNVGWNKDVFQLKLKNNFEFPHFAIAYVDEKKKIIFRTAMTDYGFHELTQALSVCGLNLNDQADLRVSLTMINAINSILKKDIKINPYEKLFSETDSNQKVDDDQLNRLNDFLRLAMPYLNEGKRPNLKELAKKAEVDYDYAKQLWAIIKRTKESGNNT